jgi:predicted permease
MTFLGIFLQVLMPIFVVAGLGYLLARLHVIEDTRSLSRVSIYVLLPALTFSAMAKADLRAGEFVSLVGSAWAIAALQAGIGLFLARRFAFDDAHEGAFLLSIITANAGNFGIPFSNFAFGPETVGPASIYYVASLIVTYVGGVLVTTPSAGGLARGLGKVLRMPILYAAAAGLLVNRSGLVVPEALLRPVQLAGGAAVPIMLTLLGVELARATVRQDRVTLSCVVGLRLVAAPALAAGLALVFGFHGVIRDVVIVQSAMPTAVGAALVAVELNARPALVSSAVLVTTLGSFLTLTVLLGLLA